MKYELIPVINVYDIMVGLAANYDERLRGKNIRNIMFGDCYINDVYCLYSYDTLEEYTGESWQDEEEIRINNLIKTYLKDTIPEYEAVMVDVSW